MKEREGGVRVNSYFFHTETAALQYPSYVLTEINLRCQFLN